MLCKICENFDVRSLYGKAAERCATSRPRTGRWKSAIPSYDGFPDFFKHHASVPMLVESSENGCNLCSLILKMYTKDVPDVHVNKMVTETSTPEKDQIYLGLTSWAPESQGFPYISAVQYTAPQNTRSLAVLEPSAPRDGFPGGFEHLLAKEVLPSANSSECIGIAADWLAQCRENHTSCNRQTRKIKPPTRLIDVGGSEGTQHPRIVIAHGDETWVALSYCWGGDSFFILKQEKLKQWMEGISFSEFPATLQDAITVTRQLGVQYIWIDALCIIQDSKEDWASEAARMGDVYQGAILTISATDSPRTSSGLLKDRYQAKERCQIQWRGSGSSAASPITLQSGRALWNSAMKSSPLNTRGWTLQESMLSPRLLSFANQQMAWECQELRVDEAGRPVAPGDKYRDKSFVQSLLVGAPARSQRLTRKVFSSSLVRSIYESRDGVPGDYWFERFQEPYDRWFEVVCEFKNRSLTVQTDVLPALSGVAAAFQPVLDDQYCAGLWKNDLLRGLMWSMSVEWRLVEHKEDMYPEPGPYCAPSWSWASIPGKNLVFTHPNSSSIAFIKTTHQAKILEVNTVADEGKPFGQISSASVMIRGTVYNIQDPRVRYSKDKNNAEMPLFEDYMRRSIFNMDNLNEYNLQHRHCEHQHFAVLQLCRWTNDYLNTPNHGGEYLALESTGNKNEYRRIGKFPLDESVDNTEDIQGIWKELDGPDGKTKTIQLV